MKTIYIGKSTDNDIVIDDAFVSRKHLRISRQNNGEYLLEDLGSTNGTFVNGIRMQQKILLPNDIVKIGNTILPWQNYFKPTLSPSFPDKKPLSCIRIGRSSENDFVLNNPTVSQKHAVLEIYPNENFLLTDLGSTNGTFFEGRKITKSWVKGNSEVKFGQEKVLVANIVATCGVSAKAPSANLQDSFATAGQSFHSSAKNENKVPPKKRIPLEAIALLALLVLAIYGATNYLQKSKKDEKNEQQQAHTEQEKQRNKIVDDDYLKDYDDEGKKIEKNEKKEDKKAENQNEGSIEDIVENAENAIFRIDALLNGVSQGFGTGFFVRNTGIGISNYHVFSPGENWQIKLKNGETYQITRIIEEDPNLDYVIFETDAQNVAALPIASQLPRKGQDVFVIGNPQGFELSVTKGIVSGIRNYDKVQGIASEGDNYIQIDAPISSGNSGGPVFNMSGEVIGIATMVVHGYGGVAQNLNLAINIQKLNIP